MFNGDARITKTKLLLFLLINYLFRCTVFSDVIFRIIVCDVLCPFFKLAGPIFWRSIIIFLHFKLQWYSRLIYFSIMTFHAPYAQFIQLINFLLDTQYLSE